MSASGESPQVSVPPQGLTAGEPDAPSNAIDYAKFRSRSHDAVIRVYDEAGRDFFANQFLPFTRANHV
jgi:hypothetical protein